MPADLSRTLTISPAGSISSPHGQQAGWREVQWLTITRERYLCVDIAPIGNAHSRTSFIVYGKTKRA
jgi:hypothetical protein